jgi:glycerol dehydrogenase
MDLLTTLDLPVTLEQLGVDATPENLEIITSRICDGNSGVDAEPFLVTHDTVYNALISADAIGRSWIDD